MRKILGIIFVISLTFNLLGQSYSILNGTNNFQIIKSDINGLTFNLTLNNLKAERTKAEGDEYYKLLSDGFIPSLAEGMPELPLFNRLFEIPAEADVQIIIIDKQEITIDLNDLGIQAPVFPHQISAAKITGAEPTFVKDQLIYRTNNFYSQPIIQTNYLGQMRQTRIARLSISPYSYNPVTNQLKIITRLKVELQFKGGNIARTISDKQRYKSHAFNMIDESIINSKAFAFALPISPNIAERMVIISDSNNRKTLQPFIKMKEQQGFDVTLAFTQSSTVGNSLTSIKSYLQGLYNNAATAPTYAILVGDIAQIPAHPGQAASTHITDLYYFEYTNDDFPEVFYGRFSCEDTTELHNIIAKTLEYEQYTMPNPNYLDSTVLIAGSDATYGPTHGNGQVNYGHTYYYNSSNGIQPLVYLHPASSSQSLQIKTDANRGVAMLNYSAHGNYDGWSNPSFKNQDVPNMTNLHKYPVMIGNACLTGTFNMNDCFGEVLTNAANKGAVGYIGASDNTYWDEDFYWAVGYGTVNANPTFAGTGPGIFDGISHTHNEPNSDWALSLAQIISAGNMAVTQGGSRVKYYWEVYHCFGDPSLVHYTKKPTPLSPSFYPMIPLGSNIFTVQTEPFALVSLSHLDNVVSSVYADSTGEANLNFNAFNQITQGLLTITAQNKEPFTAPISIMSPNTPYVFFIDYSLNDSIGNNNQKADNGETFLLDMNLTNLTTHTTGQVMVKISTPDTSIIITDSTEMINLFTGQDTVHLKNAFSINVNNAVEDGKNVKINLSISDTSGGSWNYSFFVKLFAPKLIATNMILDDASFGNGNGIADPGETLILNVILTNLGSNDANSTSGTLVTTSPLLSGSSNPVSLPLIKKDSIYQLPFTYIVNSGAAIGSFCPLTFNAISGGYNLNKTYFVVIGSVDEDFETGDFLKFKWNSIGDMNWTIDSTNVKGGNYSAKSGVITDNQSTGLELTMNVLVDDSIKFSLQTSSEDGYDYLNFFIDGKPIGQWSGTKPWIDVAIPVSSGVHKFTWAYVKDYWAGAGNDAAWLDNISFPLTDVLSSINNSQVVESKLKIYPNPSTDQINIVFESQKSDLVEISIYNLSGKLVKATSLRSNFNQGSHSEIIDINDLENGSYYIILKSAGEIMANKLIKL